MKLGVGRRIKNSIFAFFREEIMREVNKYSYSRSVIIKDNYEVVKISKKVSFSSAFDRKAINAGYPPEALYEIEIDKIKEATIEEAMAFVVVEDYNINKILPNDRLFKLSLYIAKQR